MCRGYFAVWIVHKIVIIQQKNKLPQHQTPRTNLAVVSRCNPHWDLSHSVTRSTKHVMHKNLEWSEKHVENNLQSYFILLYELFLAIKVFSQRLLK